MPWLYILTNKLKIRWYVTLKIAKTIFSHIFLVWLKFTLGKRNQVQFNWNSGYNIEPETEDDESDFSFSAKFCDYVHQNAKTWTNCRFVKSKFLQIQ